MTTDEQFLKQAIDLARQARTAGNHPFGALLVLDGRVVLTGLNTVITQQHPTAHAEHNLVADELAWRSGRMPTTRTDASRFDPIVFVPDQVAGSALSELSRQCTICKRAGDAFAIRSQSALGGTGTRLAEILHRGYADQHQHRPHRLHR